MVISRLEAVIGCILVSLLSGFVLILGLGLWLDILRLQSLGYQVPEVAELITGIAVMMGGIFVMISLGLTRIYADLIRQGRL